MVHFQKKQKLGDLASVAVTRSLSFCAGNLAVSLSHTLHEKYSTHDYGPNLNQYQWGKYYIVKYLRSLVYDLYIYMSLLYMRKYILCEVWGKAMIGKKMRVQTSWDELKRANCHLYFSANHPYSIDASNYEHASQFCSTGRLGHWHHEPISYSVTRSNAVIVRYY